MNSFNDAGKSTGIILSGYMGVGKSTIAKEAYKRCSKEGLLKFYADIDNEIQEALGIPIGQYIECYGMDSFREIETRVLNQYLGNDPKILAGGGGWITIEKNVDMVREAGMKILYLEENIETLWERYRKDNEQNNQGAQNRVPLTQTEFTERFKSREEIYENTADIIVKSGGLDATITAVEEQVRFLFSNKVLQHATCL